MKKINLSSEGLRLCPVCHDSVHGRSDKIYCCSQCKDKHYAHERKKNAIANRVTQVQLSRNQFVLDLFSGGAERFEITLAALQDMGFDQAFVTGIEHNKYGFKFKLFNYSWYPINTQKIVVYRENVANPISDFTYKRWLSKHSIFAESFTLGSSEKHSPS